MGAQDALPFLGRSCPRSLVGAISLETRAGGRRTVLERRQQLACRQAEAVSALYGDFHKPAHQGFSCCHPSESALVWEVGSIAVPQSSPDFWPKSQPGRCRENKLLSATVRLKSNVAAGGHNIHQATSVVPSAHPPVLGSEAGRRGSRDIRASPERLKGE